MKRLLAMAIGYGGPLEQLLRLPSLVMTVSGVKRLSRVCNMRGRMCMAIVVNPGPHRRSVPSFERIGSFTAMLPGCAEIAQHPLLIL